MIYLALMFVAGCMVAMQAPINSALSRQTGILEASLVSFTIGMLALVILAALFGKGSLLRAFDSPLWQWSGGLLGVLLVCAAIISVPRVGALSTGVAMILGNLAMAALIDNYGWFNLPVMPFGARRLIGLCLVLGGLFFIFKR